MARVLPIALLCMAASFFSRAALRAVNFQILLDGLQLFERQPTR